MMAKATTCSKHILLLTWVIVQSVYVVIETGVENWQCGCADLMKCWDEVHPSFQQENKTSPLPAKRSCAKSDSSPL